MTTAPFSKTPRSRLFTVLYFSVRSSRSRALRYGTFENQDSRDGKTRYIETISRKNRGLPDCERSILEVARFSLRDITMAKIVRTNKLPSSPASYPEHPKSPRTTGNEAAKFTTPTPRPPRGNPRGAYTWRGLFSEYYGICFVPSSRAHSSEFCILYYTLTWSTNRCGCV